MRASADAAVRAAAVLALAAVFLPATLRAQAPDRLVGASSNNFPPVNLLDAGGNLSGFGREIANAVVAATGGKSAHIHSPHWPRVLAWLEEGRADFIHDVGFTRERTAYLSYTRNAILEMPERIFVREKNSKISAFADLAGRTVACVDQHVTHLYLQNFPAIRCHIVKRPIDGLMAMIQGDADAFIYPQQIALYLAHGVRLRHRVRMVGAPLRTLTWHMAAKMGNRAVTARLDRGIDIVRRTGEYDRIYAKWFGEPRFAGYTQRELKLWVTIAILGSLLLGGIIYAGVYYWRTKAARTRLGDTLSRLAEAEAALGHSALQLRQIIDLVPHRIFARDQDGRYLLVNKVMADARGIPAEAFVGQTLEDSHLDEEVKRQILAADREVIKSGRLVTIPAYRVVDRSGQTRIMRTTEIPFSRHGTNERAVLGIAIDITEQQQMEDALRESEERYRSLVELSPDGVIVHDEERIVFANAAAARLHGAESPDRLVRMSWLDLVHPDERDLARRRHDSLVGSGKPLSFINRRRLRLDGAEIVAQMGSASVTWKGRPAVLAVLRDVTDRIEAENRLRESEDRYRSLVELLPDGVVVHDGSRIVYANFAAGRLYGAGSGAALVGRAWLDFVPPDEQRDLLSRRSEMISTGNALPFINRRRVKLDGTEIVVGAGAVPVMWQGRQAILGVHRDMTEYIRSEERIRRSEAQLRQVIDLVPHTIFARDRNGRYLMVNRATAENTYGTTVENVLGRTLDELHPNGEERRIFQESDRRIIESGVAEFIPEQTIHTTDGQIRIIETHKVPFTAASTNEPAVVGIAIDVTERIQAEKDLRDSEERHRHLIEVSPDGVLVIGDSGKVLFANPTALALFRAEKPEDLIGRDTLDLVHPDDRATVKKRRRQVMGKGEAPFVERRRMRLDGTDFISEARGTIFTWDGEPAILFIVRDITERKQAEDALRESEVRYRNLVEYSPEMILVHDGEEIIFANAAAARVYGFDSAKQMVGTSIFDRVRPEDHGTYRERIATIGMSGKPGTTQEYRRLRRDGSEFWAEIRGLPITWQGRTVYMGIGTDVTARRQAEESARRHEAELRRVQRLSTMGELASAIAHELNQPLAATMGYVQAGRRLLTAGKDRDDGQIRDLMEKAAAQTDRAGKIIRRMRDFIERREATRAPEDMNDLVTEAASLALMDSRFDIRVAFDLAPGLPPLDLDRIQIQQVVLNLVRNAAEAMTGSGGPCELTVRTRMTGDGVLASVCDTGPGLPDAVAQHLFEPFTSTKTDGMGVGLSISHSIVEGHGGKIWAEANDGGGTVFNILMPVPVAEEIAVNG